jgi:hypothetical protein
MKLVVFSHKPCWSSADSPSGYATDGGFPFQMRALSELFDSTILVVPCSEPLSRAGEIPLEGHELSVAPLSTPMGRGLARKLSLGIWLLRNSPTISRELVKADAVHAAIPGDIGTIGMLLAFALRKPLFVRHCGNWLKPVTRAEHFWKWFMERFAGTRNVMLATGGALGPPSASNPNLRWIFSTSLAAQELKTCSLRRESLPRTRVRLIIACRQDTEKGSGIVIESLSYIQREFPQVTLDILGDGPALGDLKRLAEKLQVSNKVTFHGKVNHRRVIELLQNADLFCYPTRASEGFPKAVLEALACGLPVITTKVSVLPQLIATGCGSLLEEATPAALARAVCEILSDEELYCEMSSQAVKTAGHYSLEQWRDRIGYELRAAWAEHTGKAWKALRGNA